MSWDLARYALDPVKFAREKLSFDPDEKQRLVLEANARLGVLNCSRQWGKSTLTAVKAVHRAVYTHETTIVVVSPTERQSGEFVRKAKGFVRKLGIRPRGDGDNAVSVLFPNGSRIVGLPGTEATVRGFSAVSLILIDEAARVPEELYKAMRPMRAVSNGDLWLMSTPFGKQGFFHDVWSHGGPEWARVQATGPECPRIGKEFLEEERRALGENWFRQEYLCEFVSTDDSLFDEETVLQRFSPEVKPLVPGGALWR